MSNKIQLKVPARACDGYDTDFPVSAYRTYGNPAPISLES